jgi:hypothetical protein
MPVSPIPELRELKVDIPKCQCRLTKVSIFDEPKAELKRLQKDTDNFIKTGVGFLGVMQLINRSSTSSNFQHKETWLVKCHCVSSIASEYLSETNVTCWVHIVAMSGLFQVPKPCELGNVMSTAPDTARARRRR